MRTPRNTSKNAALKRALASQGAELLCEVCGWTSPPCLRGEPLVHLHHVPPVAAGGSEDGPRAALCPNHHGIAHRLWPVYGKPGDARRYDGPRTPADLIAELRALDANPEGYVTERIRRLVTGREAMRRVLPDFEVPELERREREAQR